MEKKALGIFFFGLLGICLAVAGLSVVGFHVPAFSDKLGSTIGMILILAVICGGIGSVIYQSKNSRKTE